MTLPLLSLVGADDPKVSYRRIAESVNQNIRDVTQLLVPFNVTPAETAAGVTPTNLSYPPGSPRRFGNANTGNGVQDDTLAVQSAIDSCDTYLGWPGDIYAVQSIIFPLGGPHHVNFNGSIIRGIATSATDYIIKIAAENTLFLSYHVDAFNAITNPNTNYACQTWWYNGSAPSQYNLFVGMRHSYGIRGLVYGAPVGASGQLVLAGALLAGATSAVLSSSWAFATETYQLVFSDGEARLVILTKGSAAVAWSGGLAHAATVIVFCTSTAFAQSENSIYGWRTRGMQNPFYSSHINGVLGFSEPIFVSFFEEWTNSASFNWTNARALEVPFGNVTAQGGEIQLAGSNVGYAADLANSFLSDMIIETACPIRIVGDLVRITGGRYLNTQSNTSAFTITSGYQGTLDISDMAILRTNNVGSFSTNSMVDAFSLGPGQIFFFAIPSAGDTSATLTAAYLGPTGAYNVTFPDGEVRSCTLTQFLETCTWSGGLSNTQASAQAALQYEVRLSDTQSYEYSWNLQVGSPYKLIRGNSNVVARYKNHRMSMTSSDPNIYILNTFPTDSMVEGLGFDRLGYTTTGWILTNDFGTGPTLTSTTAAGPSGYLASQISVTSGGVSSQCMGGIGDQSSLANLKTTAIHVSPGELYWLSAWVNIASGAQGQLQARFFNLAGTVVGSDVPVANVNAIGSATWYFAEGPIPTPATAAYMCAGVRSNNASVVEVTDLRLRRA